MSKRKLRMLVEKGIVSGWDDPRMPTLCAMRRRGYPAEAIRDFLSRIGVAKADSVVETALLEACVRDNLNATAYRMMAVTRGLRPGQPERHGLPDDGGDRAREAGH